MATVTGSAASAPNKADALQLELFRGKSRQVVARTMSLVERAPSEQESFSPLSRTESSMSDSSSERDAGEAGWIVLVFLVLLRPVSAT